MKNEFDRQLKAQWDAADFKDFELDIDRDQLWQQISKPGKKQTFGFNWIKYAAAMILGACATLGLMQLSTPGPVALRHGMQAQKGPQTAISKQRIVTTTQYETPDEAATKPNTSRQQARSAQPKDQLITTKINPGDTDKQTIPEEKTFDENVADNPAPESIAVVRNQAPKRKTIHLLDLEKPAAANPRPNKLMMAMEEHIHPKSNDIAISTRILTKQF